MDLAKLLLNYGAKLNEQNSMGATALIYSAMFNKLEIAKLLISNGVAVVPGSAFGLEGHFRVSYATSIENLKKALERIKIFCESL